MLIKHSLLKQAESHMTAGKSTAAVTVPALFLVVKHHFTPIKFHLSYKELKMLASTP